MASDREPELTPSMLLDSAGVPIGPPPSDPIEPGLASHLKQALLRNQRYAKADVPQVDLWVDRFLIVRLIGGGGMGRVFEARDTLLGRRVAIKICRSADDESIQLLAREARLLAKLSHPNVVVVHEVIEVEGELAIVMEYIEGRTLRAWANQDNPSWREVLARFDDAGRGLEAIHAAGLEHGDFKPDNVMIDDSGRVRVVDLGIARSRPAAADSSGFVGTIPYLPPEQLQPIATGRVDVFAYCGSIWELVFGNRPYGLLEQLGSHTPETITKFRPPLLGAPPELVAVLRRGLSWTPEKRWQTIAEVRAALHEVVRDRDEIVAERWQRAGVGAFALSLCSCLGLAFALMAAKRPVGEAAIAEPEPAPSESASESATLSVDQYLALAWQEARSADRDADDVVRLLKLAQSHALRRERHALEQLAEGALLIGNHLAETEPRDLDRAAEAWNVARYCFNDSGMMDEAAQVQAWAAYQNATRRHQSK